MSNNIFSQGKRRCIDIVFCIDGTGSMSPCFENVKANARRFYSDFSSTMTSMGSDIDMMRVKMIVFRDYCCDGSEAMVESPFFELPGEDADFAAYLDSQRAHGGCGEDANGLEALYFAMKSDFVTGPNDRQVIVICADTTAIPLLKRKSYQNYPSGMVDYDGLVEMWTGSQRYSTKIRQRNKRLVMFAPAESIYADMHSHFNRSVFQPVEIHNGLDDISFDSIIKIIAASASGV